MQYVSTRGRAPALEFEQALLTGLARDGGLYLPAVWPQTAASDIAALAGLSYAEAAGRVVAPFIGDAIAPAALAGILRDAYAGFRHPAVCPLTQTGPNDFLLELFHGPTLAFKDLAMQLLGRLMDDVLARRGARATIVGATSGDTGSAAIEAFRACDRVDVFILYPHGRVSEVQRRQMTTVAAPNVHALAIDGDFDDCQALVKAMFNDFAFRDRLCLGGVNSINWARVMAQVVYYFTAAVALGAPGRPVAFSVPTGNFGDVLAGWAAKRMGLPTAELVIATNRNDILARALAEGRYERGAVSATMSPSMDIQVSSNFERALFEASGRDGAAVSRMMDGLSQSGGFSIPAPALAALRADFCAARVDEDACLDEMRRVRADCGLLIDPHTAIASRAARECVRDPQTPVVTLATAHPAKFPDATRRATGESAPLPDHLADLLDRPERATRLAKDLSAVQSHIEARARVVA